MTHVTERNGTDSNVNVLAVYTSLALALILGGIVGQTAFTPEPPQVPPEAAEPTVLIDYREAMVTAYCPCRVCCGRWADGVTAAGHPVTINGGKFVAAPAGIAFGTMMIIPGYAGHDEVPVLDRGGAIHERDGLLRIDVFFPTHQEALEWGRRRLTVGILTSS